MTPTPAMVRRLRALDPKLSLRWAEVRGAWSVEYSTLKSDRDFAGAPSARDLYYWRRGQTVRIAFRVTDAGVIVPVEELRQVPSHLFWWNGPLDHSLIQTLQRYDSHRFGNPAEAFRELVERPQDAAEADKAAMADGELREIKREMHRQVCSATGERTVVSLAN